jgi:hypothetical protein
MAGDLVPSDAGEFLLYQTEDGKTRVQVRAISEHIRSIFEEGEL